QAAHPGAQAPVGEPGDDVQPRAQRADQGHDPRVAEPQGWGPPTVLEGGSRGPLKGWARKDTALADPESIDHATVDVTGLDEDFRQMLQAAGHPEIGGVVDDGLDAKRPPALEVGLHPGVAEVGVEGDLVPGAQQPGPVAVRGRGADPAAEHDLHLFGAADVEVVGAQRLEEPAGMPRRGRRWWRTRCPAR